MNERLEKLLKIKIEKITHNKSNQESLLKEIDILSDIIIKNVQIPRKEN